MSGLSLGLGLGLARTRGAGVPFGAARIGINLTGPEYRWATAPGTSDLDFLRSKRVSFARIPTAWERWQPTLNAALDSTYVSLIRALIANCHARGIDTIIDLHNYGRYDPLFFNTSTNGGGGYIHGSAGGVGLDSEATAWVLGDANLPMAYLDDVWERIATEFASDVGLIGYGVMNEPHGIIGTSGNLVVNAPGGTGWYTTDGAALTSVGGGVYNLNPGGGGFSALWYERALPAGQYTYSVEMAAAVSKGIYLNRDFWASTAGPFTVSGGATNFVRRSYTWTHGGGTVALGIMFDGAGSANLRLRGAQINAGAAYVDLSGAPTGWQQAAQGAVDAIRAVDTDRWLLIAGDNWGTAQTWVADNAGLDIDDAQDRIVYEAHQYLTNDNTATYNGYDAEGWTPETVAGLFTGWLGWLAGNGFRGFLGECGVPLDDARYAPLMAAAIDTLAVADVPFCYWNYARHQSGDEAWYPGSAAGRLGIASSDTDQSRANTLRAKGAAGALLWEA